MYLSVIYVYFCFCNMKTTYSKIEKLKNKTLMDNLFIEGRSVTVFPLRLIFLETHFIEDITAKCGVSVGKKNFKNAVDRNRIKRVFRDSFRLHQHKLPNVDIIAMCKSDVLSLDKQELHRQIEIQWLLMQKKFLILRTTD